MALPDAVRFAKASLSRAGKNAAGFFFPALCIACGAPCSRGSAWLCGGCEALLAKNHHHRNACPLCAQNRSFTECACEYAWDYPFERIYSLFDFDDIVKHIAHAFKYGNLKRLAFFMGRSYAHWVRRISGKDLTWRFPCLSTFCALSNGDTIRPTISRPA